MNDSYSEDCDDEDKDKNYEPPIVQRTVSSLTIDDIGLEDQHLTGNYTPNNNIFIELNDDYTMHIDSTVSTNKNYLENNKTLTRKRVRNESQWQKNIKKKLRNEGKEYTSGSNLKVVPARKLGVPCNEKCRLKCINSISNDERKVIHEKYWQIGDINRQREFIMRHIFSIHPKYRDRLDSKRSLNYGYTFEVNNVSIRVCKTMFMSTLGISSRVIFTTTKKMNDGILEIDKRGKHLNTGRKVDEAMKDTIRSHIKSFPTVPSHYCRANSTRQFIEGSLNISMMYRLYVEKCKEQNIESAKKNMYQTIFNQEFNISFFKPKKDLCICCEAFKNLNQSDVDKLDVEENYNRHQEEKKLCRQEREYDTHDEDTIISCFDLQAVLITPRGEVSQFYYKRRLACYNFTVYNIKDIEGTCYFWHEGIGKRGSCEIGSCLYQYINKQENKGKKIVFYCDNCGGQNKNKFIVSLLMYCVMTMNIPSISLKFLTVGHTQNEGDSMHARIENEAQRILKGGPIYEPSQWVSIIKCAKKNGKPYIVNEVQQEELFDLKKLSTELGNNYNINEDGDKVMWNLIKVFEIEKDNPTILKYKTSYNEKTFKTINIRQKKRKSSEFNIPELKTLTSSHKISDEKKKDLLSLCSCNAIPKSHWAFYENLKSEPRNKGCSIENNLND